MREVTVDVGDEGGVEGELADLLEVESAELLDAVGGEEEGAGEDDMEGGDGAADGEDQGGGGATGAGAGGASIGGAGGGGSGGGSSLKPTQMTLVVLHDGHRFSIYRLVDGSDPEVAAAAPDGGDQDEAPDDDDPPEPPPQATRTSENRHVTPVYCTRSGVSPFLYCTYYLVVRAIRGGSNVVRNTF